MTAQDLLKRGGAWLAAARTYIQWRGGNGSSVTWGSGEVVEPLLTMREVEELAAEAVAAHILDSLKAQTNAKPEGDKASFCARRTMGQAVDAAKAFHERRYTGSNVFMANIAPTHIIAGDQYWLVEVYATHGGSPERYYVPKDPNKPI